MAPTTALAFGGMLPPAVVERIDEFRRSRTRAPPTQHRRRELNLAQRRYVSLVMKCRATGRHDIVLPPFPSCGDLDDDGIWVHQDYVGMLFLWFWYFYHT